MNTIRAVFCRTRSISTPVLRTIMWSPWSHVAPIIDDEYDSVIDATFMHGGVRRRRLSEVLDHATKYEIRRVECPNPKAAYDFARSQIGKPYDTWGVLGIGLHRDWQDDSGWFCSEWLEAVLSAGGNQRFVHGVHRVTPQHSWMVK